MITDTRNIITRDLIDGAYSYNEYIALITKLLDENRTTNDEVGEEWLEYTRLNLHRMARLDKHAQIKEEITKQLAGYPRKIVWLVLTEGWCGDAAQIVPILDKMASLSPNIELKLILRDEHPEVMDQYLTNGTSRSIPILVAVDADTLEELGSWGPRPLAIQTLFEELKANPANNQEDIKKDLQLWYTRDKGVAIQTELSKLLSEWR